QIVVALNQRLHVVEQLGPALAAVLRAPDVPSQRAGHHFPAGVAVNRVVLVRHLAGKVHTIAHFFRYSSPEVAAVHPAVRLDQMPALRRHGLEPVLEPVGGPVKPNVPANQCIPRHRSPVTSNAAAPWATSSCSRSSSNRNSSRPASVAA